MRAPTMRLRHGSVRRFAEFIAPTLLLDATAEHIDAFVDDQIERGLCASTRASYAAQLRNFWRWAHRRHLVELDPTVDLRDPKVRAGLPRPIPEADLDRAVAAADGQLRMWLLLGAYCGLRVSEIARIRAEHVLRDGSPAILRVIDGKGGKDRDVPVPSAVLGELAPFLAGVRGRLWLADRMHPGAAVTNAVTMHMRSLGLTHSAHALRHRYATVLYRASRDLLLVQRLLGHSSPATTAVYAQYDEVRGAAIIEQLGGHLVGQVAR